MLNPQYLVETADFLSEKESNILHYFYQPLLGNDAISLYRFLFSEAALTSVKSQNAHAFERLLRFVHLSESQAQGALQKLTEEGLIEVNSEQTESSTCYFFVLNKPQSVNKLFSNKSFYERLTQIVSHDLLESAYLKLKNTSLRFSAAKFSNKTIGNHTAAGFDVEQFVRRWSKANFPNLVWQEDEKLAISLMQKNHQLSEKKLEIVINYILHKNNGLKLDSNYFMKIVEDLHERAMLKSSDKLALYFAQLNARTAKANSLIADNLIKSKVKPLRALFDD